VLHICTPLTLLSWALLTKLVLVPVICWGAGQRRGGSSVAGPRDPVHFGQPHGSALSPSKPLTFDLDVSS